MTGIIRRLRLMICHRIKKRMAQQIDWKSDKKRELATLYRSSERLRVWSRRKLRLVTSLPLSIHLKLNQSRNRRSHLLSLDLLFEVRIIRVRRELEEKLPGYHGSVKYKTITSMRSGTGSIMRTKLDEMNMIHKICLAESIKSELVSRKMAMMMLRIWLQKKTKRNTRRAHDMSMIKKNS